jgi:photosystem II stability/assembly factor-like uncharacterized protein
VTYVLPRGIVGAISLLSLAALARADWELTSFRVKQDDIFSINEQKGIAFIGYERNLILSRDKGATWEAGKPGLPTKAVELEVMGDTLFAATLDRGLQFSLDLGQNWKAVSGLKETRVQCLAQYQGVLYAGTGAGVFRSRDAGRTWQSAAAGLPEPSILALAGGGGCIFAGDNSVGVFRSKDQGDHWSPVNKGFNGKGCFYLAWDGNVLFATPKDHLGTIRSSDLGDTWDITIDGQGAPYYPHSLEAYGPNVFQMIANNGGVHMTKDGGKTWLYLNPQPKKPVQPRYIGMAAGYVFVMDYTQGIWRRAASEMPLAPIPTTGLARSEGGAAAGSPPALGHFHVPGNPGGTAGRGDKPSRAADGKQRTEACILY